ncbi:Rne/Rng family ribonuclease [Phreatobacter stygius]|uniref:Ribonuclease E n=1 Tax=Phreatobacter stygius TaxID=1940610 RepID=A0A4D7BCA7_9HYPH|nr:ribonuclease E/G [Phreatobacter stygius]QCI67678.1 ribonuclease E/G [Phreatobacter stygius]
MANKMLIDAAHPEETRVVVVRGNRVEEFDFESQSRKQLRGNIYLAKVTRVEPSLQAAFIEYGGNRHGFLAFSEIHPDYYQIPVADREALLAEEARSHRDDDDEEGGRSERGGRGAKDGGRDGGRRRRRRGGPRPRNEAAEAKTSDAVTGDAETDEDEAGAEGHDEAQDDGRDRQDDDRDDRQNDDGGDEPRSESRDTEENGDGDGDERGNGHVEEAPAEEDVVESVGAGDAYEDMPDRTFRPRKQYKIQEVIKRRQVMLVQVVKEERGNKGAALTTYLSLAGRYSVLMPNTARGGGISRKITNAADRKRLKSIAGDLEVPDGMGVILRTAGANRTKTEVKRDFEYLLRMWETVREVTLKSNAPTLVYEEGSLIKRSIRDLYNKDIEEVLVAGEEGYKEAKDFMRMLMPSHAKNVKSYREPQPLFARSGVEAQLDAMFSNTVQLKSGGYIVINPTEALVAIDVNSGRSTREHNIEDTALRTNAEAADEVARQLRLRDLAGLIVVDFIDMDENRNNRAVEKRMKDALKNDRARIQVGRISHFGLLEMSRQRIRTGVLESSTEVCATCGGTGHVRSVSSVALHLLRSVEEQLLRSAMYDVVVRTRTAVALYVLNNKRAHLHELESRFRVSVDITADETVSGQHMFAIEKGAQVHTHETAYRPPVIAPLPVDPDDLIDDEIEEDDEAEAEVQTSAEPREPREPRGEQRAETEDGEKRRKRRRRRRRGRGGEGREDGGRDEFGAERPHVAGQANDDLDADDAEDGDDEAGAEDQALEGAATDDASSEGRRRRRGRRGGRRNRREDEPGFVAEGETEAGTEAGAETGADEVGEPAVVEAPVVTAEPAAEAEPKHAGRRGRPRRGKAAAAEELAASEAAEGAATAEAAPAEAAPAPAKPARRRRTPAADVAAEAAAVPADTVVQAEPAAAPPARRRRTPAPEPLAQASVETPAEAPVAAPPTPPALPPMAAPVVAPVVAPVAMSVAPAAVEEPVKRRRTPDPEPVEIVQSATPAAPRRAGWWNRKAEG